MDVNKEINHAEENTRDNTFTNGPKEIDAALATKGVMNATQGSKLVDFNDIINADHRRFFNRHWHEMVFLNKIK